MLDLRPYLSFPPLPTAPTLKWGWACRALDPREDFALAPAESLEVGDVLATRVVAVRHHGRLMDQKASRVRLYDDDLVVGVLGHRYATDAFDAEATMFGDNVDLLTNAGLLGRVRRRHAHVGAPTRLHVLGRFVDSSGDPTNLIRRLFVPRPAPSGPPNVVFVVGSGMNAGKTTAATRLTRGLVSQQFRVAALKVTGSVSPNDRSELKATGAMHVRDFSDYGFPSTYRIDGSQLESLAATMLADAMDHDPHMIVVELADGVLQKETMALLNAAWLRRLAVGAVLAVPCALSALKGIEVIERAGLNVIGVSGRITNAPLFIDELAQYSGLPVLSTPDALARTAIARRRRTSRAA